MCAELRAPRADFWRTRRRTRPDGSRVVVDVRRCGRSHRGQRRDAVRWRV